MGMRMRLGLNLAAAAALLLLLAAAPQAAMASDAQPAAAAHAAEAQGDHAEGGGEHGGEHGGGLLDTFARLFNFAILAGTLVYFLKSPLATYLVDRGARIRSDLVKAAEMRAAAMAQAAAIERKMAALPAEIEALRKAGAEDVAAEEARIRSIAEAERARLVEQARREIDAQLKLAERALVARTADLAVEIAAKRVRATITAEDQARLVDQYIGRLAAAPSADRPVTA